VRAGGLALDTAFLAAAEGSAITFKDSERYVYTCLYGIVLVALKKHDFKAT
jgi:hypothetical protein